MLNGKLTEKEQAAFQKARNAFAQSPHWPHFVNYIKALSTHADTTAIKVNGEREVLVGRARAYCEIIDLLYNR